MELINMIIEVNTFLEGYFIFHALRFVMGTILVILGLNIVILMYILIVKDRYYRSFSLGHNISNVVGIMEEKWRQVKKNIQSNNEKLNKKAVIDAGDMVYEIFKKIGYEGDTLGEQLKDVKSEHFLDVEKLQKSNIIRNQIIKDPMYNLDLATAQDIIKTFGEVLVEQEAIKEL